MNNICQNILKTLAYFDIFNYPLKDEEIVQFLPGEKNYLLVRESLKILLQQKRIFNIGEFYSLKNRQSIADRRIQGNKRARQQLTIAARIAKLLGHFPFVQTVCVSGSLSKNFADQNSDIDFFIITEANRLWIARTFMHLFKKLTYLIGKQHWFCMNYFIDEKEMEIVEKNIFTAMEIITLKPMQGTDCYKRFMNANSWTKNYLPEQNMSFPIDKPLKKIFFKGSVEKIFSAKFGDAVERWLMNITDKRWKKKTLQNKLNNHGDRVSMMVSPHFSKPDPGIFQLKIIKEYESRVHHLLISNQLMEIE